jgi:N-methylhydantoinase A/oxoprolinase/acetone carboxylase beta subunit
MGLLINIDTGGTLTDFCIVDGDRIHRTKSITTAFDLSRCLFDGLTKASQQLYGTEDLRRLIASTDHIRYSTTQGTNALVERKGPRLGIIYLTGLHADQLTPEANSRELYAQLIEKRHVTLEVSPDEKRLEREAVSAVNHLALAGAVRLIVAGPDRHRGVDERRVKRILLRKFPPHLLGALPVLYSHELVADTDDARRTWTAVLNAFLHPGMERFLYSAEHRLQEQKIRKPLLIFRNDGGASRVARTPAIKTYSSGPRGGAEALRALASHYGFTTTIGIDVGGTTTDLTALKDGGVRTHRHGIIEGVATSLPLCDVTSVGVGGSSIIRVVNGVLRVGPDSVGSAPGPACFGFGGTLPTITDALLAMGLLDPQTYLGGTLRLDPAAGRAAIDAQIAQPLGIDVETALTRMESAWVSKVVDAIRSISKPTSETVLAAFGGAGPLLATRVAAAAGITRVLIPGLAAVFSAFGVGFSDIVHEFERTAEQLDASGLKATKDELIDLARRAMFAEGVELDECMLAFQVLAGDQELPFTGATLPQQLSGHSAVTLRLRAVRSLPRFKLAGAFGGTDAKSIQPRATRRTLVQSQWLDLPVITLSQTSAPSRAAGPLVLEEDFFTALVDAGWSLERNSAGDILLTQDRASEERL